jgi:hypothetical protein
MQNKLKLMNVTLFALSSIYISETISSLLYSSKDIEFGSIKFLTHEKPKDLPEQIEYIKIPEIKNIMDYNHFCFSELGKYIDTTFGLLTQHHAFVLSPEMWNYEWLEYDYIGAPWPIRENSYIANNGEKVRVGNGGFSLRSKYLMRIPKNHNWTLREDQGHYNEDGNLVCYYRKEMLQLGIRYAPIELAINFSYENLVPENYGQKTFGFHRNISPWQNI